MPYKRGAPLGDSNRLKLGHYAKTTFDLRRPCQRALCEAYRRLADARQFRRLVRTFA